jgi:hypothetical protein
LSIAAPASGKSNPPEAARRLELAGIERAGKVLGYIAEQPGLATLLRGLDPVPVAKHLAGRVSLCLAEHVGMAADQLLGAVLCHLRQIAAPALLQQQ